MYSAEQIEKSLLFLNKAQKELSLLKKQVRVSKSGKKVPVWVKEEDKTEKGMSCAKGKFPAKKAETPETKSKK